MATYDETREALVRLHRFTVGMMSSRPDGKAFVSMNDMRFADTILGESKPGEYGDESDPWPEDTKARLAAYLKEPGGGTDYVGLSQAVQLCKSCPHIRFSHRTDDGSCKDCACKEFR